MGLEVIVLAAGRGTRMKSNTPKVMHPIGGEPMLSRLLETVTDLSPHAIHVVIAPDIRNWVETLDAPKVGWVEQLEQLGTGHAAAQVLPKLQSESQVLIVNGDGPLIEAQTLKACVEVAGGETISLVTADMPDPKGMGRIVRDADGTLLEIVEDKDLGIDQKEICEVNSGILSTSATVLHRFLPKLTSQNSQKEYYLTDLIGMARCGGVTVHGVKVADYREILGVNDRKQLAEAERVFQRRQADKLMLGGLSLADPSRIDIRGELSHGLDCEVDINVLIEGTVELGDNVVIGPNCCLRNSRIASNTHIKDSTVIESADIGAGCSIGPFARIRPGTELAAEVHIGNFVELKKSHLESGAKVGHLAYIGDAEIGSETNVGAGVITCNFDGERKHRTVVGDRVFVGTNSSLVAPLTVADGAYVAAGSTITKDVPEGDFAIARQRQKNVTDGASRFRKD